MERTILVDVKVDTNSILDVVEKIDEHAREIRRLALELEAHHAAQLRENAPTAGTDGAAENNG